MKGTTRDIILIIFIGISTFFINNKVIFPGIMESRNIVTAREMVINGNYMLPKMNGALRLEKPPLPTWIAAAVEYVSPDNIILQRIMAGLVALFLVFFLYKLAYELTSNRNFSLVSSLVLMTSYNIILMGRTATWDIYCHSFMLGAIYFLFRSLKREGPQLFGFLLSGIFMGLSFLSKGPVSFYALLLPFLLALPFLNNLKYKGKLRSLLLMIVVMLIISTWWYTFLIVFHYDEFSYVLHKESGAWINHNVRSWYYYSTFFLETGVWALLLLSAIILPFVRSKFKITRKNLFMIMWLIFQLVLLSLLPEKKNRYLLPILIPAAYIIAELIVYWKGVLFRNSKLSLDKIIYKVNIYLIALIIAVLPIGMYFFIFKSGNMSMFALIVDSIIIWSIAIYLFYSGWKSGVFNIVYGVVTLFLFAEIALMPYVGNLTNNPDFNSISQTRNMEELKDLEFYNLPDEELRIEIVYAACKEIHPLSLADSIAVEGALPFVILTHKPIDEILSESRLNTLKITYIGHYDDNRRPKSDKHHNPKFEYYVNLLNKK